MANQSRHTKRKIEKIYSQFVTTLTNSTVNTVLHTAEDSKTLVRTIVDIQVTPISGGAYGWVLAVEPSGVAVEAPVAGNDLDNDLSDLTILRGSGGHGANSVENHVIRIDSKGMRKVKTGDEIVLRHLGDAATMGTIQGTITLIFKE